MKDFASSEVKTIALVAARHCLKMTQSKTQQGEIA